MPVVLVNPITKQPTGFEPRPEDPKYFTGLFQNVTTVTDEWLAAEWERLSEWQRFRMEVEGGELPSSLRDPVTGIGLNYIREFKAPENDD